MKCRTLPILTSNLSVFIMGHASVYPKIGFLIILPKS
jgi:hypothetical protein